VPKCDGVHPSYIPPSRSLAAMMLLHQLRTNHNALKYLFDQPTLNARHSRWLEFLCEYDFDIKHIKGKENKVADAISRRVHELHATTISMYQTNLKGKISEAAKVICSTWNW
jgi:hypothetical protein